MLEKHKIQKKIKQLNKQIADGNLQAMYDLAMIFLDGSVIKKDTDKAYELLKQASDAGHLQSKTFLISKKISDGVVIGAKAITEIQSIFKD